MKRYIKWFISFIYIMTVSFFKGFVSLCKENKKFFIIYYTFAFTAILIFFFCFLPKMGDFV
jgi:hypothetical protein